MESCGYGCKRLLEMVEAKSANARLLGNSAWNASAFILGVGLNLVILPFVLYRLGSAVFGVAGLVSACIAPALAISNAISVSTTRELASRLGPGERGEARRFFSTSLALAGLAGVLVALLLALGGPPLAKQMFKLTGTEAAELSWAFVFGAGGWLFQCLSATFLALFAARQDYSRLALINIAVAATSTFSMLILIPSWPYASTFLGCQALGFGAGVVIAILFSLRAAPEAMAPPIIHRGELGEMMNVGVWQFLAQTGGLIAVQADRYLLGAFLAPQFVGYYTVAQRLQEAMYIGVLKVGEILFPFFSSMRKESSERVADLLFRSSWVLNVLAASALGGLIPVAPKLLLLWTGAEVAEQGQRVLVVLSVAGMMGCSANVFSFYLLAQGRSRSLALISLLTALATLSTSALVLPRLGWEAAGWSALAGMTVQIAVTVTLLRKSFELPDLWARVGHFVLLPLATGVAAALSLRYFLGAWLFGGPPHWWSLGISYLMAAAAILIVVLLVSRTGPYGAACWRDMESITRRFLPIRFVDVRNRRNR